ncbi:hypothetical protein EFN19_08435, partial [Propionibacterium freudenreichii]|nr:hypothetical protein [Propionibacterium freudenreichii]MCT3008016.1 hypothetical protein [Propionibacterium freudenreichii]
MPRVRPNGWWAVVAWIVSRSLMACLFINLGSYLRSDVIYYFTSVQGASPMHLAGVLSEYPVPIVWLIQLLAAISGPSADVFVFVFAATMGGLDAACCRWLWRHSPRACSLWIAFTFLIGPLIWFRIDLVPAALVLAALTMTTRRPAWSGAAV